MRCVRRHEWEHAWCPSLLVSATAPTGQGGVSLGRSLRGRRGLRKRAVPEANT